MFIFDHPYISDLAETFLATSRTPLLRNEFSTTAISKDVNLIPEEEAIRQLKRDNFRWVYTNSENAIAWIVRTFGKDSEWARKIERFKDKHAFRRITADLFPDITFLQVPAKAIGSLTFDRVGGPFVIKPVVGFISAGVYRVNSAAEWNTVQKEILRHTKSTAAAFPEAVLNSNAFLVESIIPGEEYAVDAYFDDNNQPVILNILHHRFRDEHDMSDRLYITSTDIIDRLYAPIERFLKDIAGLEDLRGFPLHAEVRIDTENRVRPVEINPLRFSGWCSTDIACYAYGINVYEHFASRKRPDWETILKANSARTYAMAVIERPDPLSEDQTFDYEKLGREFSSLVSLREMDYRRFPICAFVFFSVGPEGDGELNRIQALNPARFVTDWRWKGIKQVG